ncbi:MAG: hypothetical protein R2759_09855 [Bacteroidales bacterium]
MQFNVELGLDGGYNGNPAQQLNAVVIIPQQQLQASPIRLLF